MGSPWMRAGILALVTRLKFLSPIRRSRTGRSRDTGWVTFACTNPAAAIVSRMLAAAALSVLTISAAAAHARLRHASPAVGSMVAHTPRQLSLWFTEGLEPAFSGIVVRNANGVIVTRGKAHLGHDGRTELQIALKPLPAGSYKVEWHAMSVDTHKTHGTFNFTVGR